MKKLVLNNIGIGFTNTENIKEISDNIKIIKKLNLIQQWKELQH